MRGGLRRPFRPSRRFPAAIFPVLLTLLVATVLFTSISMRLEPLIETMAMSNALNEISLAISWAAAESLSDGEMEYPSFVDVVTNETGRVTSLSFRSTENNRFKQEFILLLCKRLGEIESDTLSVPIGNLSGILWLSARGPDVRVSVRSVGDVSADYENEFTSVGVNQTRHAIFLKISVTIYLMIPGKIIPVTSEERICIAETVIVGEVPATYLNLQDGDN